jgi:hypothetical protein
MKFRILLFAALFNSVFTCAQHKGFSYELQNDVGAFQVVSLTVTHAVDNSEGVTFVINKHTKDTLYQIDDYLHGWVGLSRDGQTLAHLISELKGEALDQSQLAIYRNGNKFDKAKLSRLISYQLSDTKLRGQLSKKGWLKNDSVLHKMASNPFYVSEDKLFISFDDPKLSVFDLNKMFHIYTGNGANHFTLNYYSIPNAPFRTNYDWGEYIPNGFPNLKNGMNTGETLAEGLSSEIAIPEMAKFRANLIIKLKDNGNFELREADVYNTSSNEKMDSLSHELVHEIEHLKFKTDLIPPNHPAWIFEVNFWLR